VQLLKHRDFEVQLAAWRAQMTPEERASLKVESVKGAVSQNLLEALVRFEFI
jgi:hypothetical protein